MATRNSGHKAMPLDKYYTPPVTIARDLAPHWQAPRRCEFWEPCAGAGNLAQAIERHYGQGCLATDIAPDRKQRVPVALLDFLQAGRPSPVARLPLVIITNPPYGAQGKMAERCLAHALKLTEGSCGAVAFLLPFGFDAARQRVHLTCGNPAFCTKIVTAKRLVWTNLPRNQSGHGPAGDHAWFVWDWNVKRRAAYAFLQMQVAAPMLRSPEGEAA